MFKLLLIATGGAVGTLARYGTSTVLLRYSDRAAFPIGTLVVNLVGCLLIGYLNGLFLERVIIRHEYRLMLLAGFLGGYTTFSTFGWEVGEMLRNAHYARAAIYLAISNVVGITLVIAGYALGRA